jgi:hypothetical protein
MSRISIPPDKGWKLYPKIVKHRKAQCLHGNNSWSSWFFDKVESLLMFGMVHCYVQGTKSLHPTRQQKSLSAVDCRMIQDIIGQHATTPGLGSSKNYTHPGKSAQGQ